MSTNACNLAKNLSKSFARLFNEVTDLQVSINEFKTDLQVSINELKDRLFALEEKERARSREEHDREMILDEKFYQEVDGH